MELVLGIDKIRKRHKRGILALGTFDGVHLGHQKVIKSLKRRAKDLMTKSIVLTFDIHPLKTIDSAKCPPLLTPKEEKINLIQNLGVDILILANFDRRFASLSPEKFIRDILVSKLSIKEVFVGKNFTFGRGATGDITFLRSKTREYGFKVRVIPPVKIGKKVISSTAIRELIKKGKVKKAALLLGRPYALCGRVIHGESRGKELGYPTANIRPHYEGAHSLAPSTKEARITRFSSDSERLPYYEMIPSDGVYLGRIKVRGRDRDGLLNIGTQPTFHKRGARIIETYIFNFNGRIYGRDIKVSFLQRIRNEIAFKSPEALKTQIRKDIIKARKILHFI